MSQATREDQQVSGAGALIQALEQRLDAGDLAGARRADIDLEKARQSQHLKLNHNHERRLATAHRRLHELRDWQHWANNKQRQRLCKQVEALPESGLHPDALLQALREAQAEWKQLEESEKLSGERGAYRASGPGLWRRFRTACNRAFNHARPFLEKRTELRSHNLEAVQALIQKLEKHLDAKTPADGGVIARELGQARQVLSRLDELPPRQRGITAKRLRTLIQQLNARLKQQQGKAEQEKIALVQEAQALQAEADLDKALQAAKRLNQRWKRAGSLPRGRERRLWQELRKHLDPLFERQKETDKVQQAARDAERAKLQDICIQAEKLAALEGDELESVGTELNKLRSQWQTLGVRDRRLRSRFKKAQDDFRHRLAEHKAKAHFAGIRSLFEQAVERQQHDNDKVDTTELERHRSQAETLCLELELIAGVDSPAEAQAARMDLKVRQLNNVLRGEQAVQGSEEAFQAALARWAEILTLPSEVVKQTQARVKTTIEAFYGRSL